MKVFNIIVETNYDVTEDEVERAERVVSEIYGTTEVQTVLESDTEADN